MNVRTMLSDLRESVDFSPVHHTANTDDVQKAQPDFFDGAQRSRMRSGAKAGMRSEVKAGMRSEVKAGMRSEVKAGMRSRVKAGMRSETVTAMRTVALVAVFLLLAVVQGHAQYYQTGADPARIKWNRLDVGNLRLIYPMGMDSLAFRYAYLMETAGPHVMESLTDKTPKLPIVFHPYNVDGNGLVVWAPKRMELKPTPPPLEQNVQNWEKQLVVHEMRHVAQMKRSGEHFFEKLSWFIGEQSEGIAVGLYFCRWFLEGDATLAETKFSWAGRGRDASFLMPYKAYFAAGKDFSLDKWYFGSYKDVIPNHYATGYFRLSVADANSRPQAFSQLFTDITKTPYWPFAYRRTFKQNLGSTSVKLWEPAKAHYSAQWEKEAAGRPYFTEGVSLAKPTKDYVSYRSPLLLRHGETTNAGHTLGGHTSIGELATATNGEHTSIGELATATNGEHTAVGDSATSVSLYAIKRSLSYTPQLVHLDVTPGAPAATAPKERVLCMLGSINSRLNTDGRRIYWSEVVSGARWAHENYSVIRYYDLATGKKGTLRPKTRYFNPVPSPNGRLVAAAHYRVEGGSELHLLDSTGVAVYRFTVPDGKQLSEIQWFNDKKLLALLTGEAGKELVLFDSATGSWTPVLHAHFRGLYALRMARGRVLFESDLNGTNNIYALNLTPLGLAAGAPYRLTEVPFGAFDPSWSSGDGGTLVFSDYSAAGYTPTSMADSLLLHDEASFDAQPVAPVFVTEGGYSPGTFSIDSVQVPEGLTYPVQRYRKFAQTLHVHSWMPFYFNMDQLSSISFQTYYEAISLGATVLSQNTLGTAVTQLGYRYHKGFHSGHFKYTFTGWYPVLSAEMDVNDRHRSSYSFAKDNQLGTWTTDTLSSPAVSVNLRAYIPFSFSGGGWTRGLIPSVRYQFTNDRYFSTTHQRYINKQNVQGGLQYYQMKQMATRDIFPRLGFGLTMQYAFPVGSKEHFSTVSYMQLYGYLPGFLRNQALKINMSWQKQQVTNRYFYLGTFLDMPRGLENAYAPLGFSLSADYAIPFVPDDWSAAGLLYIKRIQLIPFADFARLFQTDGRATNYSSFGADLLFDFHILRIGTEISTGVRMAYTSERKPYFQLLFSVPAF